jgi:F0F1-type ATP synthase membrane subunit b/b'
MYFDETAWVAIAFILFIALVWKKGSKAITSTLDDRSLLIQKELDEAKSLKEEALEENLYKYNKTVPMNLKK